MGECLEFLMGSEEKGWSFFAMWRAPLLEAWRRPLTCLPVESKARA